MTGDDASDAESALLEAAGALLQACQARGLTLVTAESCTGGLVSAYLTAVPGASDVLERGFVTYSNMAKSQMLGVPVSLIATHGAVSEEVAQAMAEGALARSQADVAVAVTGVAGPDGGTADKPVGLVYVAAMKREGSPVCLRCTFGDIGRDPVRLRSVAAAFELVDAVI